MPTIPCSSPPSLCPNPQNPIFGYDSAAIDGETFLARASSPTPPPIAGQSPIRSFPCVSFFESQLSQEIADLSAARGAASCANSCAPLFVNTIQACPSQCPDGSIFYYVIAEGQFAATNQLLADRMAFTYACKQIAKSKVCLSDMSVAMCLGGDIDETVRATGRASSYVIAVSSGTIPPGTTFTQVDNFTATFTGTPTEAGVWFFAVRATDSRGNFMQKVYTVRVIDIDTSSLTSGQPGVVYNAVLSYTGVFAGNALWSIVSGALPFGLTLDPLTGQISGTPSVAGQSNFTVQISDGNLACQEGTGINVQGAPPPPPCPAELTCIFTNVPGLLDALMSYHPGTRTLWVCDSGSFNLYVTSVDAPYAVIQTIDLTVYSGAWDVVYDSVNNQMVVLTNNGSLLFFNPVTYTFTPLAGVLNATAIEAHPMAYDSSRGYILAADIRRGSGADNFKLVNCATHAVIVSNPQASAMGCPVYCSETDVYYFSYESTPNIKQVNPTTLVVSASTLTLAGANDWIYKWFWFVGLGQLWCQRRQNVSYTGVIIIDPTGLTLSGQVTGADVPAPTWSVQDIAFDSCSGRVWISDYTQILGIEPVGFTEVFVDSADVQAVGLVFIRDENALWMTVPEWVQTPCPPV